MLFRSLQGAEQLNSQFLQATFAGILPRLYEEAGIEIPVERVRFEVYQNPRGNPSCQGRLYYRSRFQTGNNMPAIKLDLTADEILLEAGVWQPVGHPYSDVPQDGIESFCYSYNELFAEKLRALGERTRARDLYDVIHLHRNSQYSPDPRRILELLTRKCAFKEIPLITLDLITAARDTVIGTWEGMLRHQLPQLPSFSSFWEALAGVFEWLHSRVVIERPPSIPMESGAEILNPRFGGFSQFGRQASVLELIRFAAQNRQLVALDYTGERTPRRIRMIEPYSLRRSRAGAVSLAAHDVEVGHIKFYRVDRIHGAQILERTFVPRHEIELSPAAEPIAARMRNGRRSRIN